MQIKSLLAEKERMAEDNRQKIEMMDNENERVKTLEMKLSSVF